ARLRDRAKVCCEAPRRSPAHAVVLMRNLDSVTCRRHRGISMNKPIGRTRQTLPATPRRATFQRRQAVLRYACETLETRRLLADLSGMVYHDVNANGQKDLAEARQQGFQIFIDSNRNGVLDSGEPSSISDG